MTKETLEYWLKVVGSVLAAGSLLLGAAQVHPQPDRRGGQAVSAEQA